MAKASPYGRFLSWIPESSKFVNGEGSRGRLEGRLGADAAVVDEKMSLFYFLRQMSWVNIDSAREIE